MPQFTVTDPAPGCRRVTFDHPPVNLMTARTAEEPALLVGGFDADESVEVVVFDSANPDFFTARYDFAADGPDGADSLPVFLDPTTGLSRSRVLGIAAVRGRARNGGSEFALACDLRYASVERAVFGQPAVATGLLPAGGGIERLAGLAGRSAALEIVLGSDDFDAVTAQRHGRVTRALPDDELDAFVDRLARRIAGFDQPVPAATKAPVDRGSAPPAAELRETRGAVRAPARTPSFAARFARVREIARAAGPDFELDMGHHLGTTP